MSPDLDPTGPPRGTTAKWEALTWSVITAAAVFAIVAIIGSVLNYRALQSIHPDEYVSPSQQQHVNTISYIYAVVTLVAFVAYLGSRRAWFVMTRRAIVAVRADPAPILGHRLMRAWRIAIVAYAIVGFISVTSRPATTVTTGLTVRAVLSPLGAAAIGALLIVAVVKVRRLMRALPPPPAPAAKWNPSRAELANEEWRTQRRF
jgi:hypothetical protein